MDLIIDIFSRGEDALGEAPVWHPVRGSLFWLDIINQKLYEKHFDSSCEVYDRFWHLPEVVSYFIFDGKNADTLWMVSDKSFGHFSLSTGIYHAKFNLGIAASFRSNDGGISPDGALWFGTMEKEPSGLHGSIYRISPNGEMTQIMQNIGIPNTFCWSKNGATFFLSDSLQQKMFAYDFKINSGLSIKSGRTFVDLTGDNSTPDGGAIDIRGNIWNSQWDGFQIVCYNPRGVEIGAIKLPVARPTSCCFGGPNNKYLFITTAKEGLSKEKLVEYSQSGSVFVVKLSVEGQPVKAFSMEE